MKRFLSFLFLLIAIPGLAWAEPRVSGPAKSMGPSITSITFGIGDTTDSPAIGVSGYCTVRFQQASGDDAALYAVTTSGAAASSGTLLRTFTASTSPSNPALTFTASTQWVKAKATDATAGGSVMVIECNPTFGNSGGTTGSFAAGLYTAGSSTGGIVEALNACEDNGGGVVILPPGNTAIDATATGVTNPVINMPTSATTNQALCDLIGFGDSLPSSGSTTMETGSSITISNSAGVTGIRVNSSGQRMADFTLQMLDTNASTIGVEISSKTYGAGCDGTCEKGELGVDNWSLDNVDITGPASLGPGIGLDLTFALKGEIKGGEIQRWDSAINFSNPADLTGSVGHSNANVFMGLSVRESDIGINAVNLHGPDLLTLVGTTIEGNTIGAYFTGPSGVTIRKLVDHSSHWENTTENLRLSTDANTTTPEPVWFEGIGSYFTGATIDITRDYYAAGWDPDKCTGCFFAHGITYANFARMKSLSTNWYPQTTAGAQTNATGTFTIVPSYDTCTNFYGASTSDAHVAGDVCYEAASNQSWVCEPGADGVCNSAAEWIPFGSSGSAVYGPTIWAISNGGTLDTGDEVCAARGYTCQDVLEFGTPATPTDSTCATAQTSTNKFLAMCK